MAMSDELTALLPVAVQVVCEAKVSVPASTRTKFNRMVAAAIRDARFHHGNRRAQPRRRDVRRHFARLRNALLALQEELFAMQSFAEKPAAVTKKPNKPGPPNLTTKNRTS
jgi:hypothetical protein